MAQESEFVISGKKINMRMCRCACGSVCYAWVRVHIHAYGVGAHVDFFVRVCFMWV